MSERTLLLLHGMGGSGAVWRGLLPLLESTWAGPVAVPDLPGHGRAVRLDAYSFEGLAEVVAGAVEPRRPVVVLGHSLGGAVGLALAARGDVPVEAVVGVGVKVRWSEGDLAAAAAIAARPVRTFATRAEAVDRALKVAGLDGLVDPGSAVADSLVVETAEGWRQALDPGVLAVGEPDVPARVADLTAAGVAVTLASGSLDPLSPPGHLAAVVPDAVVLPGLGHSAHVEDPAALLPLLDRAGL